MIVEPVCGNMGVIPPQSDFLSSLRSITRSHGALFIFDEVITGFRVALGGAQEFYGIQAGPYMFGKNFWWRISIGRFWRKTGDHGFACPRGAGLPSGNAFR